MNNIPNQQERHLSPKTSRMIGRQKEKQAIQLAISNPKPISQVFYITASGGTGKTRLLEEIPQLRAELASPTFLWSGIIDLYHSDLHDPLSLAHGIARGLVQDIEDLKQSFTENQFNPDVSCFQSFFVSYEEYQSQRALGVSRQKLQDLRQAAEEQFLENYSLLASVVRLVISLDTLENIQYQDERAVTVHKIGELGTSVKRWLMEKSIQLPNTVLLLSTRQRHNLETDLKSSFTASEISFVVLTLTNLTDEESREYLRAKALDDSELNDLLDTSAQGWLVKLCNGRPIRLALLIDALKDDRIPIGGKDVLEELDDKTLDSRLVEMLLLDPEYYQGIIPYLIHARKGLDVDLLSTLLSNNDRKYLAKLLAGLEGSAVIKVREVKESGIGKRGQRTLRAKISKKYYLHDEIYDIYDRYITRSISLDGTHARRFQRGAPDNQNVMEKIASHYRSSLGCSQSLREQENCQVTSLYYELMHNPRAGYELYYTPWSEQAIRDHANEFDMRLRDEFLRFLHRYVFKEDESGNTNPYYVDSIAKEMNLEEIERANAVRWVKRHIAYGDFYGACDVAEVLASSQDSVLGGELARTDKIYQANLAVAWGEAMIFSGESENSIEQKLEGSVALLENYSTKTKYDDWWKNYLTGRAYSYLGYHHRTRGRYGLGEEKYKIALLYYQNAGLVDEIANTKNSLAYLLALLGRATTAEDLIKEVIQIRSTLGLEYPLLISMNTEGLIWTLQDIPERGVPRCRTALKRLEQIKDPRGIGLAHIGLGFCLRKRANLWKIHQGSPTNARGITDKRVINDFDEAKKHLMQGMTIFHPDSSQPGAAVFEPIRYWEALNELGSLHCDWGWWLMQVKKNFSDAKSQYDWSIYYQELARNFAHDRGLTFQEIDSIDDLAQAYGDLRFLYLSTQQSDESRLAENRASQYIEDIFSMIPPQYHLHEFRGFDENLRYGEAYWLILGKAHHWRGLWLFRSIKLVGTWEVIDKNKAIQAARDLILAIAYFNQFWPGEYHMKHALTGIGRELQQVNAPIQWALEQVAKVEKQFNVDLTILSETLENRLGKFIQ